MEGRKRNSMSVRESRVGLLDGPSLCFFPSKRLGFPELHGSQQMAQMWRVPLCQLLEQPHALLLLATIPGRHTESSLAAV